MELIYGVDGKHTKETPSPDWGELKCTSIRDTNVGHILFLGVRGGDRGSPTVLMPPMNAPFGQSCDTYNRISIDLSMSDGDIQTRIEALTTRCKNIILTSKIANAEEIAKHMLPISIQSPDHYPRIRIRMNGSENIRYRGGTEYDTIPKGSEVRGIIEIRNIWVRRNEDGVRAGVGLYLHSASVRKSNLQEDLTEFLFT